MSGGKKPDRHSQTQNSANETRDAKRIASTLASLHHTIKTFTDHNIKSQSEEETKKSPAYILNRKAFKWVASYTIITFIILVVNICQWQLAKDAEHRQFQAYLGPQIDTFAVRCLSCNPTISPDKESPIFQDSNAVIFKVHNYGITPARKLEMCTYVFPIDLVDLRQQIEKLFTRCDHNSSIEKNYAPTVWPGEGRTESYDISKFSDEFSDYAKGRIGVLISRITYVDVFGTKHNTYVCRGIGKRVPLEAIGFFGCNPDDERHEDN